MFDLFGLGEALQEAWLAGVMGDQDVKVSPPVSLPMHYRCRSCEVGGVIRSADEPVCWSCGGRVVNGAVERSD